MNFFQPLQLHKRKRDFDDISDEELQHQSKQRKAISSLPIRTPFKARATSGSPFTSFNPPAPLTPVDSSEDESLSDENHDVRTSPSYHDDHPFSSSNTSTSPSIVYADPFAPPDTTMMMSPPPRPRFGRARSNDLVSPTHLSSSTNLIYSSQPNQLNDRIPTPIASHFDNRIDSRLSTLPFAPRHQFPPLRQFLSPMIEQEGWGAASEGGLPSPAAENMEHKEEDADVMMGYEQTNDGMSGLRVTCDEDTMDEDVFSPRSPARELRRSSTHPYTHSRNGSVAKLHMGYLAGCSKCEQKVPGHYSHILR